MDKKKYFKEIFKWGSESDENRKKAIGMSLKLIALLNETSEKKFSEKELEKISGGFFISTGNDIQDSGS